MKKIAVVMLLCVLLSLMAFADDATQYKLELTNDVQQGIITAKLYVSQGNAVAGHFGLRYNTEKLKAVESDFSDIPEAVPDTDENGASYLKSVVKTASDKVVITPETNKVSTLVMPKQGKLLFGWYATMDVDSITPSINDGAIAQMYFKLVEGVSISEIELQDIVPVSSADCAGISGWSSGIIVINKDNKIFSYNSGNSDLLLKIELKTNYNLTEPEDKQEPAETPKEDIEPVETPQEQEPKPVEPTEEPETAQKKVCDFNVKVSSQADRIRVIWERPEQVDVSQYIVEIKDKDGFVVKRIKGITEITRSITVKELAPDFEFVVSIKAIDNKSVEYVHQEDVKIKTVKSENVPMTVFNVTYEVAQGSIYGFDSEQVIFGQVPTKVPTVFAPEGYSFKGWSVNGEMVSEVEKKKIYEDTTFKAEFEKNQ